MADQKAFRFGPVALTTTMTTNLLSPPDTTGGVNTFSPQHYIELHHISILNRDSASRTFSLWLGAANGNVAGTEVIAQGLTVPANQRHEWFGQLKLDATQYLVGGASANSVMSIMGAGVIVAVPAQIAVAITDQTSTHVVSGGPANAGYRYLSTGVAQKRVSGSYAAIDGEWLLKGTAAEFESRMVQNSGDPLTSGTLNTWEVLSSNRTWELSSTGSDQSANLTASIRRASDLVVVDTATIILNAFGSL